MNDRSSPGLDPPRGASRGRTRAWLPIGLLAILALAASALAAERTRGQTPMSSTAQPMVPAINLEAEPQYVLEFPILIALTLRNETDDTDYLNLPDLGLLAPIDSLEVGLSREDGGPPIRLGPAFETRETNIFRTELMAGESLRVLIDISQFGGTLRPGRYTLQVAIFSRPGVFRRSAPTTVELLAPTAAERDQALHLRRLGLRANAVDAGSWQPFLTANWNTVAAAPPGLGPLASRQLALHLALHRAAYGPDGLVQIPVKTFDALQGPVLAPEGAALEYELLAVRTRGQTLDALRARILAKWPGLARRLDQVDAGSGTLKVLRYGYGAERGAPRPPGKPPYT